VKSSDFQSGRLYYLQLLTVYIEEMLISGMKSVFAIRRQPMAEEKWQFAVAKWLLEIPK
jgi:hypothetical protein